MKKSGRKLIYALLCYAVLILGVLYIFLPVQSEYEKRLLGIVLLVFTLLILKTVIHSHINDE
jgi:hypothetical protein